MPRFTPATFASLLLLSLCSFLPVIGEADAACRGGGRAGSRSYPAYQNYQAPVYRQVVAQPATNPPLASQAIQSTPLQPAVAQPNVGPMQQSTVTQSKLAAADRNAAQNSLQTAPSLTGSATETAVVSNPIPETVPQRQQVKAGATIKLRMQLPADPGRAVLKAGPVILNVELKNWTTGFVVLKLPELDLLRSSEATLFILSSDAKPIDKFELELVPSN